MIASLAYTFMFLFFGVMSVRFLLPRHRPLNRLWLGLSLGLLEEMWLPAIGAFLFSFDVEAHVFAAGVVFILTILCWFLRDRRMPAEWDEKETALLRQLLVIGLPLTILGIWLQYTHVMRVAADGSWHVGQSTYGDLPMHLSFITGLVGKKFPADYPFYPGNRLSYPFLMDSLSSTFYLLGCSLQAATILPASLMMALCYMGVLVLARDMTSGKKTALLAAALFFLNGGLGFLYDFDLAGSGVWTADPDAPFLTRVGQTVSDWFSTVSQRVEFILTGYYKTPTNQPDPNNLRWSNVICDMMVPQRTLLGGWCMVIPCFYLLNSELRARMRDPENHNRGLVLLGTWAGALPLIHTHSFLALGLASFGAMCYDLIHGDPKAMVVRKPRGRILLRYLAYAAIAAVLAVPQLVLFTFAQTFQEGSRSFLTLQFNWVNNPGGYGMRDLYLWFYIKNIGLPFLALIAALFEKNPRNRRIFCMALPIILAAEFVRFQPNEYDNNKLLYLAWLLCCMIIADWGSRLWKKLEGFGGRRFLAAIVAVVTFLSAGLTIWRECVSDYTAFGQPAVEAGEYVKENTPEDAVFITGTQHLNPVLSIAGRTIVCGPDLWLYWHGFDTAERNEELAEFYGDPESYPEIPEKYGAEYVYVSSYERQDYDVDEEGLAKIGEKVFENREASIYRLTREKAE
ncbi:hypothetical protein [Aristaeella lactis]|uniref:Uncharacterized protein n=1 Tax=Aristaeella lactis TaxID=3046383 RepID=A0AC61PNT3_9FIRM|nr:hypothetical protein [Aristaeella lactis]QUA53362.1 hypothetical protein JYE50_01660 [Aristaeella lactis]SMC79550.1 hypothetical protein SAMN06297397_2539 [Aristaeella lactis]